MSLSKSFAAAVVLLLALPAAATVVPCAGGTIDIAATSDTPMTLPVFNVGQQITLNALITGGITPSSLLWTIDGPPNLKDFDERVGTLASWPGGTGPISWSTTPLTAADLSAATVSFYWIPSAGLTHPSHTSESRNVKLTVVVGTNPPCIDTHTFTIERNTTNINQQAEDFYTSTHRAVTETNTEKGRVIDDHMQWHTVHASNLLPFLPWHREFIGRADRWRATFGYPPVIPWYPGGGVPTGPEIDHALRLPFSPDFNRVPTWFTLAGASAACPLFLCSDPPPIKRLKDFLTDVSMSSALEGSYHGQVHCNIGPSVFGGMCDFSSPKDPIFFRWHKFIDLIYENYCLTSGTSCTGVAPVAPSDVWMGDNPADVAAGGLPPSPGPHWVSPDIWNVRVATTCTPADPLVGVTRDCGSEADHVNPLTGVPNFLYATLRNDRPGAQQVSYVEVAVYVAAASTGLAWPINFGGPPAGQPLDETRQFITLNLQPGAVTDIGPLPWIPPSPTPSGHFCLYIRILSVANPLGITETADIDSNTANSNNISWRNITIVPVSTNSETFIFRNTSAREAKVDLKISVPPEFQRGGTVALSVPAEFYKVLERGSMEGLARDDAPQPQVNEKAATFAPIFPLPGSIEKALMERIEALEKAWQRCAEDAIPRVRLRITGPSARLSVPMTRLQEVPMRLEFSHDDRTKGTHRIDVEETVDGRSIGGITFLVVTGH
jgi:hypothetical protein